jgi:hypothetical protein
LIGATTAVSWAVAETKETKRREAKRAIIVGFFISWGTRINIVY